MVTTSTTHALVVVFAPTEVAQDHLSRVIDVTAERMHEFTKAIRRG
jgi:DNA/RNA-binding domain of Phe-tRNA-synthetase-like protein